MNRASRVIIALGVVATVLCTAAMGAAKMPSARASSTSNEAWIYTGNFRNTVPDQISGSIEISATKGATASQSKLDVSSKFTWQDSNYSVRVTCPFPISGEDFPGHGPVQFMRPVLGTTDLGTLDLPETYAHVAVYGRSTITRDGKMIADNQPTIVLVAQAIHGSDGQYLSSPATDRNEIMLIVPGPLSGQTFVTGFANGCFYIYWPSVKLTLSGDVKPMPMPANIPSRTGRGPATPMIGTEEPRGTIDVSLTNTRIVKKVGEAPSGLYDLSITNNSSTPRGLIITGIDLCCTIYTRYSKILRPGGKQIFRWYFAPGKAHIKDFVGAVKTKTSYTRVKLGGHSSSIMFQ